MRKFASALYRGSVVHRRLRPKLHKLRYNIFNILFDLDELDRLDRELRLFSRNRFNLFGFHDRDFGDGKTPLREYVEGILCRHGLDISGGPVRLLCMPRVLGYVFNPLSVYFCYRRSGELTAVLYEVSNTFGERHYYLVPASGNTGSALQQSSDKRFHVSPFLQLGLHYRFRIAPPAETVAVSVHVHDKQGLMVAASLAAQRLELTNGALFTTLVLYPLLTLKVVAGIHWEALKLWLKGVKVWTKPEPPEERVTLGKKEDGGATRNVIAGTTDRAA
jgi:DUF1365 family protein